MIRPAAVAGTFYPASPVTLRSALRALLAEAPRPGSVVPRGLIVPHAGYTYSGPIAASAYGFLLGEGTPIVRRVVLLGTAHRGGVRGLAASSASAFATPLGLVPVDQDALGQCADLAQVRVDDEAHRTDHALEVQLPFLQVTLGEFAFVPLLVGRSSPREVAEVVDRLVTGPEDLLVVSSDLSHYLGYDAARQKDHATALLIEARDETSLTPDRACGAYAVAGSLLVARRRHWRVETVDLRNSGDTSGRTDRVVGYGAFVMRTE